MNSVQRKRIPCRVDGCGDFALVKKSLLCVRHYSRFRGYGRTDTLTADRPCQNCGKSMSLHGANAAIQVFCSEKCRAADKRSKYTATQLVERSSYGYRWRLMNSYGITIEQYQRIWADQYGLCAICFRSESEIGERLCVDHDHDTGIVRGLLCRKCNKAIGGFCELIERVERAAEYMKQAKAKKHAATHDQELEVIA